MQIRMRILVRILVLNFRRCGCGCGFLQSHADLDAESIKFYIHPQNFASFCINPYNCTDFNADFCKVMRIWMRISVELCGSKQCGIPHIFASADADADFRKYPYNCVACEILKKFAHTCKQVHYKYRLDLLGRSTFICNTRFIVLER